jgi:nucleoside 2-deoxyribosyltransferase
VNIYFGGSIAGGRDFLGTYRRIVDYLKSKGHDVPTEHVAQPDVLEQEKSLSAEQIYTRDIEWLQASDCVISEVSNPSLGVGYEICYALRIGKPVLCIYRKGVFLTRMLVGNTSEGITVREYENESGWQDAIDLFLKGVTHE